VETGTEKIMPSLQRIRKHPLIYFFVFSIFAIAFAYYVDLATAHNLMLAYIGAFFMFLNFCGVLYSFLVLLKKLALLKKLWD